MGIEVADLDLFDYVDVLYSLFVDLGDNHRLADVLDKMLAKPLWMDEETFGTDPDSQAGMSAMMALGSGALPAGAPED